LERAAVYRDRWGEPSVFPSTDWVDPEAHPIEAAIGPRPGDPAAAADWDGVARSLVEAGVEAATADLLRHLGADPTPVA
ncbi:MAG: hypothetical protein ACRDZW_06660, partial [Acidimicrobiales bacterium]